MYKMMLAGRLIRNSDIFVDSHAPLCLWSIIKTDKFPHMIVSILRTIVSDGNRIWVLEYFTFSCFLLRVDSISVVIVISWATNTTSKTMTSSFLKYFLSTTWSSRMIERWSTLICIYISFVGRSMIKYKERFVINLKMKRNFSKCNLRYSLHNYLLKHINSLSLRLFYSLFLFFILRFLSIYLFFLFYH